MEKIICPDCGKEFSSITAAAAACPFCNPEQKKELKPELSDTDYQYLNQRDFSVPENYPGY
ncbi:MAG: hypothetical protein HUN04_10665 [Desulfobacter sp.]|nr:MAG: hypothetical protein HUN04_10665 [Desulfobacter sp.]